MRMVTIIISAYDSAQWLEQCIDSVCSQRIPRGWTAQIVLGVDACPRTLRVAEGLKHKSLIGAYFPNRVGPYIVFNTLACSFKSNAYGRFDADDVMLDGYLQNQLDLVDRTSSSLLTQSLSTYVDERLTPLASPVADALSSRQRLGRQSATGGQFLFTQKVWQRLGGFQPWQCAADTEFIRRARWADVTLKVVPRYLYLRRVHSNSLTRSRATGYKSKVRQYYNKLIALAHEKYVRGASPERIYPVTTGYFLFRYGSK
jgi:glycosyltransferase involved in cell wall biosynthesis